MGHRNCLDELIECLNNCRKSKGKLKRILCASECLTDFLKIRSDEIIAELPPECRKCFKGKFEDIIDDLLLGFLLALLIVDINDPNPDCEDHNSNDGNDSDDCHNDDHHHHHDHKHEHQHDHKHDHKCDHEHQPADSRDIELNSLKTLMARLQEEIIMLELEIEKLKAQR